MAARSGVKRKAAPSRPVKARARKLPNRTPKRTSKRSKRKPPAGRAPARKRNARAAASIRIKRVYDPPAADDGVRILIDRLWPRGMPKARLKLDAWVKHLAPSNGLRKWYR